jgi:hypothetical protein
LLPTTPAVKTARAAKSGCCREPRSILQTLFEKKNGDGALQEKSAELRIEGSSQKIILGTGSDDEATIDWLGYEISEWLDLPLEVVN